MRIESSFLREEAGRAVYSAALLRPDTETRSVGSRAVGGDPGEERSSSFVEFSVADSGVLSFDNRQPQARRWAGFRSSRLLAEEMMKAAEARVPGALKGRSLRGIAREIRIHYRAWRMGIKPSHSVTAEMGSSDPAAPDYDGNAVWFEHPIRSLPRIVKALLKKN